MCQLANTQTPASELRKGLWEASPLCEWNKAVVCHTGLKKISLKTLFYPSSAVAGWQNDPNPVIENPPVLSLKSTLTGDLRKNAVLSYQACHCTLWLYFAFTTNSVLSSVSLPLHFSLCLSVSLSLSHTHTHTLCSTIYSFVLCPFRAPVLQEHRIGGVSTGPLCSFPLCQNRDVQNCS